MDVVGVVGLVQCLCHLVKDIFVYFLPHAIYIQIAGHFLISKGAVFLYVILGAVLVLR